MEMERLAEILEAVKVMPLRSSDFVIFRTPVSLSLDQQAEIYACLEEALEHSRILIIDQGADLEVLRRERDPDSAPPEPVVQTSVHRPISGPAVEIAAAPAPAGKAPGAIS